MEEIPFRRLELTFHSDPGHAWLEVGVDDVDALGIAAQISTFSYMDHKGRLYLEEDCDAPLFINAAKAAGWDVEYTKKYAEDSFVRRLSHYELI